MSVTRHPLSAPLEEILVSGGDARSAVDARTGLNRFGCSPSPRPGALSFGSSTASTISERAYGHVQAERDRFLEASRPSALLGERMETLRGELKRLLEVEPAAAEVVFSPSGTDSTLHALFVARALGGTAPMDCVLVGADETGTGVPLALSGRHFSTVTAEGVAVAQGGPILGLSEGVALVTLPIRTAGGGLRAAGAIERDIHETVARSVATGRRVLLQVMDCSKLGVRCPSQDCLRAIQRQFGDAVQVVVDACQMRLSRDRLRWHLAQGHLALISGSKFFTGPPFSGALLVPARLSQRFQQVCPDPTGLRDYTSRDAWPLAWESLRAALPDRPNFGQYFRWAAALEEMRAYFSVPVEFRRSALSQFAAMTAERLHGRWPDLVLLEDEILLGGTEARTIFAFRLRCGGHWMPLGDITALHGALNRDVSAALPASLSAPERALAAQPCHIGQPVALPGGSGALRVCASARTVSDLWLRCRTAPATVPLMQEGFGIDTLLDKIALLSRHLPLLAGRPAPRLQAA